MNDFFKQDFLLKPQPPAKAFLTDKRTVCVKTRDGKVTEHKDITNPWRYIAALKKNLNVERAWIKNE
jgi:hypothetical protein